MASDTVEKVKEKLSIVEVVQPYVKLTKSGKYWRGLSPFNKEKTPSFFVNVERGSYYCFSSAQGGDMFTFIEKMEGVDFKGALKMLAEKAGIELVPERAEDRGKRDKLREAVARAERLYADSLTDESEAYAYALSRGLTKETIREWNLGFAPNAWRTVLEHLGEEGYTTPELLVAGLIKEADEKRGTWYDRFRNRLMFPIRDSAGRTVGFTGRSLDPEDTAKYLNSPETELFRKSEVLFGMDRAKDAIRTRGFALLVEGQMDLLHLHQIGFANTIALSGTTLSKEHITLIKRYADNLMLALDADRAGLAASMKTAIAALAAGMRVKAVRIPEGKDPADLAREDPKDLTNRIKNAESIVEFFLNVLIASESDPHRLIVRAESTVLPLIAAIQSPMEREHFVGVTARMLSSTPEAIRGALPKNTSGQTGEQASGQGGQPRALNVPQAKPAAPKGTERYILQIRAIVDNYPDSELAKKLENEYSRIIGAPLAGDPIPEHALFEAGLALGEDPAINAADELLYAFEKALYNEQHSSAILRLRQAEASKDELAIKEATDQCNALQKLISKFP